MWIIEASDCSASSEASVQVTGIGHGDVVGARAYIYAVENTQPQPLRHGAVTFSRMALDQMRSEFSSAVS